MSKVIEVVITSGGANWLGKEVPDQGKMHGALIHQMIFDAEEVMPKDPVDDLPPKDGRDPEIQKAILDDKAVKRWLSEKKDEILDRVNKILEEMPYNTRAILNVGFRCKGGFQRSVVMAKKTFDDIVPLLFAKAKCGENELEFTIVLHHLTIPLATTTKGVIKDDPQMIVDGVMSGGDMTEIGFAS